MARRKSLSQEIAGGYGNQYRGLPPKPKVKRPRPTPPRADAGYGNQYRAAPRPQKGPASTSAPAPRSSSRQAATERPDKTAKLRASLTNQIGKYQRQPREAGPLTGGAKRTYAPNTRTNTRGERKGQEFRVFFNPDKLGTVYHEYIGKDGKRQVFGIKKKVGR